VCCVLCVVCCVLCVVCCVLCVVCCVCENVLFCGKLASVNNQPELRGATHISMLQLKRRNIQRWFQNVWEPSKGEKHKCQDFLGGIE